MARLIDAFTDEMNRRADRGLGGSPARVMERFGWTTRDIAEQFGVSQRTARRWRQQDRIPEKRREDFDRAAAEAARSRMRRRIEARGLRGLTATGTYRISKSRYRTGPGSPVRIMPGNKITGAEMRNVFAALDAGDTDRADELLNDALAEAYEGEGLTFENVETLDYEI